MSDPRGKVKVPYLVLSLLCGLFALGAFVYVLYSGITGLTDDMISADMPGTQVLELAEPGSYTVFHEWTHAYPSTVVVGGDEDAQAMHLTLTDAQGKEIPLLRSGGNSHYQMGSREGYSLYTFQIAEAGSYTLSGSYDDGSEAHVMFTLANNFMGKILWIIGMCFVCLLLPAVPGVLFLVLALKPLSQKTA